MRYGESLSPEIERIATIIVDAAFKVHTTLGPGLLESIYSLALKFELERLGLRVAHQLILPVFYDGHDLGAGLRIDLLVEDLVIVEVKAVEKMIPVFQAQI